MLLGLIGVGAVIATIIYTAIDVTCVVIAQAWRRWRDTRAYARAVAALDAQFHVPPPPRRHVKAGRR